MGGLGTFAALIYVIRQFNLLGTQSSLMQKNIRASLDGQLYARLDSFNKFIVDHDAEYGVSCSVRIMSRPERGGIGPNRGLSSPTAKRIYQPRTTRCNNLADDGTGA